MPALMRERDAHVTIQLEPLARTRAAHCSRSYSARRRCSDTVAVDALLKSTGGNPLFVEETVRMLMDRGVVDEAGWHRQEGEALPIPNSLQSLIGSRLDQLVPAERRVAQHASVVGSVFWPGAVAHLQNENGAGHDAELDQRLGVLERRDLIREHDDSSVAGEREFAFKHILIRDVAYGRMPRGRRAQLHLRFADWTEGLSEAADEFVEIVAYHLEQACLLTRAIARATIDPPIDRAVHALSRAGERAERREGMREADRFYMRALELLDEDAQPALELHLRRGTTLYHLGKVREAQELLVPLADHARIAGRLDLRCAALGHLAQIDHRQGRVEVALERLDEALRLAVQAGDRQLQVRAAFCARLGEGRYGGHRASARGVASRDQHRRGDRRPRRCASDGHLRAGMMLYNQGALADAEEPARAMLGARRGAGQYRDEARATSRLL